MEDHEIQEMPLMAPEDQITDRRKLTSKANMEKARLARLQQSKIKKDLEERAKEKVKQELLHQAWQHEREAMANEIDYKNQKKKAKQPVYESDSDSDSDEEVIYVKPKKRRQQVSKDNSHDELISTMKKELEALKNELAQKQQSKEQTPQSQPQPQPQPKAEVIETKKDDGGLEQLIRRKILNF